VKKCTKNRKKSLTLVYESFSELKTHILQRFRKFFSRMKNAIDHQKKNNETRTKNLSVLEPTPFCVDLKLLICTDSICEICNFGDLYMPLPRKYCFKKAVKISSLNFKNGMKSFLYPFCSGIAQYLSNFSYVNR